MDWEQMPFLLPTSTYTGILFFRIPRTLYAKSYISSHAPNKPSGVTDVGPSPFLTM